MSNERVVSVPLVRELATAILGADEVMYSEGIGGVPTHLDPKIAYDAWDKLVKQVRFLYPELASEFYFDPRRQND